MALSTWTLCAPGPLPCQGTCFLCTSMCPVPCLHSLHMSTCWLLSEAHLTDTVLQAICCSYSLCMLTYLTVLTCVPLVPPLGPPPLQRAASFSPTNSQQTLHWDNQKIPCHPFPRRFEIQCREGSLLFLVWVLSLCPRQDLEFSYTMESFLYHS